MTEQQRIEKAVEKAAYKSHPLGNRDSVSTEWAIEAIIQERNKAIDAARILEEMVTASYVRLDCNGCLCNLLPAAEAVIKSIKRSSETLNKNTE